MRPVAEQNVQTLSRGLQDRDREVRAAFLSALGDLGTRADLAVPAVRNLLRDESPEIRALAVDVLSRSAPRDERLLGDLVGVLKSEADSRVQRQAIVTIRSLGSLGRDALPTVIEMLNKAHPDDVRPDGCLDDRKSW